MLKRMVANYEQGIGEVGEDKWGGNENFMTGDVSMPELK